MTVNNESFRNDYTGTGSASTFTIGFKILSYLDIKVIKRTTASGAEATLTYTTDYTLAIGDQTSSLTLTAGVLASGYTLHILVNTPFKQNSSFRTQDDRDAATDENTHDTCRNVDKHLKRGLDGAVKLPETDDPSLYDLELPAANARASTLLGFDSGSNIATYAISNASVIPLSDSNAVALGTAAPGTANTASRYDHVHPTTGLVLTTRTISTTAPLTGGSALSSNMTLAITNANTSNVGAVLLAADGGTTNSTVVQATDSRLKPKYVLCCPIAVTTTVVFPVIPCADGTITTINTCIQTAPTGSALNATFQLVHLGNMAVQSNFATISINASAHSLNTSFNAVATNTSLGLTQVVTAVGSTIAGTNLTNVVK